LLAIISIIISQVITIINPLVIRTTIDSIIGDNPIDSPLVLIATNMLGMAGILRSNLWIIGLIIIVIALLRGVFLYFKNTLSSKSAEGIVENHKNQLYDHIHRLTYKYHVNCDTGDIIQTSKSDVDTIRRFLAIQFMEVVGSFFMLVFTILVIMRLSLTMSLISIAVLPITFTFAIIFFNKVKNDFQKADEAEAALSTNLQENLTGIQVVKAFARQKYE